MNSVMEIGETILFLKDGNKAWEGSNKNIFKTDNETVTDFVYSQIYSSTKALHKRLIPFEEKRSLSS